MISRLLLLILVVAAAACDKVPLTAPSSSTITINAASPTLGLGGSTQVSAFVVESSGTPVQNGTTVRFTTNLGRLDPVEALTRNGVAVTTFHAGDSSGTAQVRATSGGIGGSGGTGTGDTAGNVVNIVVGGAAASVVVVSANPTVLPVGGGTSTVIASVLDASGNRLRGVPVTFSTNVGSLSSSVATTDANGDATVQLTTNRTATVTARASGGATGASGTVEVRVATENAVTLAVTPNPAQVGQAVTLTITPPAAANSAGVASVTVNWGDGTVDEVGLVASARTVSHVYNSAGAFTINVTTTADGSTANTSIGLQVNPRPAVGVTIAATPAAPDVNQQVTLTATVTGSDATTQVASYRWQILDSGGGTEADVTTAGPSITRVFTSTGLRTVIVTVTFSDGRTATSQIQLLVD